ncbi:TetR/AcrR family transcriptional regulator [Mycolicibacterium komossense]|jgi:AcrR family transcriptional regulator|uniref:TetR/AcrR family transcriptional regulator n=1 Tax=Mycolicibacterium komossense TaxID=1779 RepID=A0ABT3CJF9_9MYCO|nr:TetR/AcrR family transcriptional regulator [Mycolicibacterium komossense]MCV7229497.1 TetR/AcrR family transcriptional regulator [Mycolicibacterium komossense]
MQRGERQVEFATRRRTQLFDELVTLFLAQGFARFTLDDIAAELHCSKSTLYTLAKSKDQLVRAATIHFFRVATEHVDSQIVGHQDARARITTYLTAVGSALERASDTFMADLADFAPAREVYEMNTRLAAARVQELIHEGVVDGTFRDVHAAFAADLVTTMMVRIQQRGVRASSGLEDADAYRELATILTNGISS